MITKTLNLVTQQFAKQQQKFTQLSFSSKYNFLNQNIKNLQQRSNQQQQLTKNIQSQQSYLQQQNSQISSIIYGKFNFVPHFNYFQGIPKQFKKKIVKGHLGHKRTKESSFKKAEKQKTKKYIQKAHYGLLKRIRIVGNKDERRFKFHSTGKRHLMRKKSLSNLKRKSRDRYIAKADVKRIKRLLPKWKQAAFKNRH